MKIKFSIILALGIGLSLNALQAQTQQVDPGFVLLQRHCYACHNPNTTTHDEIIAPPLFGIKNNYRNTFPEKDKFINAMVSFINSPSEEKALMKGPIKRFGLMPKPSVSPEEVKLIVNYIESNELQKPKWFDSHHGK